MITASAPLQAEAGGTALHPDWQLIDRISYLASLASVKADVDPLLDTLRVVTSRYSRGEALNSPDKAAIRGLEVRLKDYLLNKDPLRAFTEASLNERLRQAAQPRTQLTRRGNSFWAALILAVVAALVPLAIPPYVSFETKAVFSVPLFFLGLAIGTAKFYLTALANFRPEFRRAFIWVCLGVGMLSLAFSHYAVIQAFNLYEYPVFRYSGITWMVTLSFMCMYGGLCVYARLLQVTTLFATARMLLVVLAGVGLATIVPHVPVEHELYFDISFSGIVALAIFAALCAGVASAIVKNVTSAYAKSMRLLYYYFAIGSVGSLGSAGALWALGQVYGPALSGVILVCGIAPQLLLLYTGYSFKKETSA